MTKHLHTPGATVAMYSGGVDSYCMAYLFNPDVLLYCRLGGRYGEAELESITPPPGMAGRIRVLDLEQLGWFELEDSKIIPGRNAILALLAAQYGDTIMMGSVDSSTGRDKDRGFTNHLNDLFDYMFQPQRWLPDGRQVRMVLPVYHLTKTQLVGAALAKGHPGDALADATFSCYEPYSSWVQADPYDMTRRWRACGKCPPCGRKWMAFAVYGIDVGFNGRAAIEQYKQELEEAARSGIPPANRSEQFTRDVLDAWYGVERPFPSRQEVDRWLEMARL